MKLSDFKINQQFSSLGGMQWLCTDIGTRTITAILLDFDKNTLWFQGPPYSVQEHVFDEINMKSCFSNSSELIKNRVISARSSYHPNFSSEDVFKMFDECVVDESNYNFDMCEHKILNMDRITPDFNILHPYSMQKKEDGWYIKVLDIFKCTYHTIHEDIFITYRVSTEWDLEKYVKITKDNYED